MSYFLEGWRFHSPIEPIKTDTLEDAIEEAFRGREDNTFYATCVRDGEGNVVISERHLQDAIDIRADTCYSS